MSQQYQIPGTPRVTSPSPTPSEAFEASGSYFAPITRSAAKRATSPSAIAEEQDTDSDLEKRARTRSRSPKSALKQRRPSGLKAISSRSGIPKPSTSRPDKQKTDAVAPNGESNGYLSPASAASYYWREFSRSPSPLGLIPIHRHWRSFIHRHEIPRKALHLSIGFFTLNLYTRGIQPAAIHPWLLAALIPIASVDLLRHRVPSFNRFYVRVLGAMMRESEVNDKYNGVIWYLLGAWIALRFFPKDVGAMGVLLLSWCDTAASTFGRLYGRYTPRLRRGKSLAGSAAAAIVGVAAAGLFYGVMVPRYWGFEDDFMFRGTLSLPEVAKQGLGLTGEGQGTIGGWLALGVISLWSGLVASASEVVDLFGWDDNLTIPVLSCLGLSGFLKVFG
ncbi:hypothetical protein MMC17_007634 [Xylographa soralifera]|nr:hypothetical protein [Xylographa soralifera]